MTTTKRTRKDAEKPKKSRDIEEEEDDEEEELDKEHNNKPTDKKSKKSKDDNKNKGDKKNKDKKEDDEDKEDDKGDNTEGRQWTVQKHSKEPQKNLGGERAKKEANAHVALIVVDVINDLDFEGNEYIVKESEKIAPRIKDLANTCREKGVPVIYCNDNWSQWQSNFEKITQHCTSDDSPGKTMSKILQPDEEDYIVIKPKHSAFFSTTLDVLLNHLRVKTVIIVGVATNICILFTANDAYMRDYAVIVPDDCTAANTEEEKKHALKLMHDVLKANIGNAKDLRWDDILKHSSQCDTGANLRHCR